MARARPKLSWFDGDRRTNVSPADKVAEIYFRTNDRWLDQSDVQVVTKLATLVRQELTSGKKVELTLIGSADSRGAASYNQWLSEQRVKAVADRLGRLLHDRSDFCCLMAVGLGETFAVSGLGEEYHQMDRVVWVWWTPPRIPNFPALRRYTFGKGLVRP